MFLFLCSLYEELDLHLWPKLTPEIVDFIPKTSFQLSHQTRTIDVIHYLSFTGIHRFSPSVKYRRIQAITILTLHIR